jgi:hypothetical protein
MHQSSCREILSHSEGERCGRELESFCFRGLILEFCTLFPASLQEREPKIWWCSVKRPKVAGWIFVFACYNRWPIGHVDRLSSWRLDPQLAQGNVRNIGLASRS